MKRKFGELVRDVKVSVDRANNPYEFYVAGDHMDSEDFRIHRKGCFATDDVGPAFIRIFRPGQVLYGSRRTYLKKVCVADFEGVTANTTFVLETRDENVLMQKLLPFLMLSDGFTDWSIKHSKGSTNPYVLFRDLANYEFDLPDLSRQKELVEILWAANDLKEKYKQAIAASDEMLKAKFREMFGESEKGKVKSEEGESDALNVEAQGRGAWRTGRLGDLLVIERGGSPRPISKYMTDSPNGINWIKIGDVAIGDKYITKTAEKILPDGEKMSRRVYPGDFLLSNSMSFGRPYILQIEGCIHDGWLVLHDENKLFDSEYLYYLLGGDDAKHFFETQASGSTVKNLNKDLVGRYEVCVPPLALQLQFVEIARKTDETKAALRKAIADVDAIIKGLING